MMNLFYVVWDYVDERLFDKRNTSDCAQFSELLGWPTSCKSYPTALTQIFHASASFKMGRVYLQCGSKKGEREGRDIIRLVSVFIADCFEKQF